MPRNPRSPDSRSSRGVASVTLGGGGGKNLAPRLTICALSHACILRNLALQEIVEYRSYSGDGCEPSDLVQARLRRSYGGCPLRARNSNDSANDRPSPNRNPSGGKQLSSMSRGSDFAKAIGKLAKTDTIDAQVLAHFADAVRPALRPLPDAATQVLGALVTRRRQLVEMLSAEENRRKTAPTAVRADIQSGQVATVPQFALEAQRLPNRIAPGHDAQRQRVPWLCPARSTSPGACRSARTARQ
jgi:hypothetical protein